jgi:hypothetical protein
MAILHPDDRYHIEIRLGRELTGEELAEVETFDDLSFEQLSVVTKLGSRVILASAYVRAVVPSADFSSVQDLVFNIQDFIDARFPPARLPMEPHYVGQLGRPLTEEERWRRASISDLTKAQVAVVRQLSSKERVIALLYLRDVVKSASIQEREAFVDASQRDDDEP